MPEVVGLPIARAVDRLGDAGFDVRQRGVFSQEPPGRITAQEPGAGEKAAKGSEIRINYSRGENTVTVPDVLGLAADDGFDVDGRARFEADYASGYDYDDGGERR